jgi:hypothetical protein
MRHALVVLAVLMALSSYAAAQSKSEPHQTLSERTETLPDSPLPKQATQCLLSNLICGETSLREQADLNGVRSVMSPRQRVADKKFWLMTSGLAASTALHVLAVNHCRHTVGIESCEGKYGTFRVMQGLNIALSTVMAGVGYGWKKTDDEEGAVHSRWWVIPTGTAAFMGVTAIQQYHKRCPAGTHFSVYECE